MSYILVLCHGNMFRSPAAEYVLREEGLNVVSRGFHPSRTHAAKRMREVMAERGYDLTPHVPRIVVPAELDVAAAVLYMDGGNRKRLEAMAATLPPDAAVLERSFCLGHFVGLPRIQDPAFKTADVAAFQGIVANIVEASKRFATLWKRSKGSISALRGFLQDFGPKEGS